MEGMGDVVDANLPRFHLEPHSEPDSVFRAGTN